MLNENVNAKFLYGAKTKLTNAWHDKNVICPNSKLFYIIKGEIVVEIEDRKIIGKSGDMMLIPAQTKHSFYLKNENIGAEKYWFHFDLKNGNESYFNNFHIPYSIYIGNNSYIKSLFEKILKCDNTSNDDLLTSGLVLELVAFYLKNCNVEKEQSDNDEIDKIITYIKNNYTEKLTINSLSKKCNFAPTYFIRKFKEKTGYSPIKYQNNLKIESAKFLLSSTDEKINVIMEKTGFYDASLFSKLFKLNSGYSPKKFREIYGNRPYIKQSNYTKK